MDQFVIVKKENTNYVYIKGFESLHPIRIIDNDDLAQEYIDDMNLAYRIGFENGSKYGNLTVEGDVQ